MLAIQSRIYPIYRAGIATLASLFFGLAPIFCAWIAFTVHGKFREHFASTLAHGDALMIATAIAGPAMILAFKRRQPETMIARELVALFGLALIFLSVVVYMEASSNSALDGSPIQVGPILNFTYVLLSLSSLYALFISYLDERSSSLREFNKRLDTNGNELSISFPEEQA